MDRTLPRRSFIAILVLLTLTALFVAWAPGASAASSDSTRAVDGVAAAAQTNESVVRFGEDVVVGSGETYPTLVVFGGDIDVQGAVEGPVVAFGGDVRVAGTVTEEVVAFGGRVVLESGARVGTSLNAGEDGVIAFGGEVDQAPGAEVSGDVREIKGGDFGTVFGWMVGTGATGPIREFFSFGGWVVTTLVFLVLGLVAAALLPNQLRAVERHLAARPGASVGWGALTFFVIAPLLVIALVLSVVGILVLIPGIPTLLLAYFFAVVSVGAFIAGRFVKGRVSERNELFVAVALGVVATSIVSVVPVIGGLLILAMTLFGTGATLLAIGDWRRRRKTAAAAALPPGSPVPPGLTPPPGGGAPPYQPEGQMWQTVPSGAPPAGWPQQPQQAPPQWPQQGPPQQPQQAMAPGPQEGPPSAGLAGYGEGVTAPPQAWPGAPAAREPGPDAEAPTVAQPAVVPEPPVTPQPPTPPQAPGAAATTVEAANAADVVAHGAAGETPHDEAQKADVPADPEEGSVSSAS